MFELRRQGAEVLRGSGIEAAAACIGRADVVMLHLWNTPRIWRLLASDLPAARYMVWAMVLGSHPPQLFNSRLLAAAAELVFTAPPPAAHALQFGGTPVIPGLIDRPGIATLSAKPHDCFNVDYIGTTNRGKMHPRFIGMMARLEIPDLRVRICGGALDPAMAGEAAELPRAKRFECRGFVEDIAPILATSDVFAYPLAERTYATSDKTLQEAMLAGVPPVILPHGGPSRFVTDGKNGIVAANEDEFVAAIEHLYRHPEKRRALALEARRSALALFATDRHAADLMGLAEAAARREKARIFTPGSGGPPMSAAAMFLISQDWDEAAAVTSVAAFWAGRTAELISYAQDLDDDGFQVEGGILHWRKEAMDDPILRTWAAVWLLRHGRTDDAEREMAEAVRLGAPPHALPASAEPSNMRWTKADA
jgi:hypothetical protein